MKHLRGLDVTIVLLAVSAFGLVGGGMTAQAQGPATTVRKPAILILNKGGWPPALAFAKSNFQRLLTENGFVYEYDSQPGFAERNNSDVPTLVQNLSKFDLVIVVGSVDYEVAADRIPPPIQALTSALGEYHRLGGGLFFMPEPSGYPGNHAEKTQNYMLKPFGAEMLLETVWDETRKYVPANQNRFSYFWTEAILPSPVTTGVKCLFLPLVADHDAAATVGVSVDQSWQVVVSGMPEAQSHPEGALRQFDRVYDMTKPGTYTKSPPIMAIQAGAAGAGRMALLPVFTMYTLWNVENAILGDVVWTEGNGYRKSDMKTLLFNTFHWLAEPALQKPDFGGFTPLTREQRMRQATAGLLSPLDWSTVTSPAAEAIRKGLVGAHTSLTDGQSTVAEYVAEAKRDGLSFLVFTEPLPLMTPAKWDTLKAQCAASSGADFHAIPGLEYLDETGGTFLEFNMKEYPAARWITKDGRINDPPAYHFQNGREGSVALCLGDKHKHDTMIDPFHYDLYSHTAVFSYDHGKLIDDSTDSYQHGEATGWDNVPIVFSRITAAAEVSKTPMFTYVQANSMAEMNDRFMTMAMLSDAFPHPVFVSGGPLITVWSIANGGAPYPTGPGKERYRVYLQASSDQGLKEVRLVEATTGGVVRRYLPGGEKQFSATLDSYHFTQPFLIAYVTDTAGKVAVSSCITTTPNRNRVWTFKDLRNHPAHYFFINEEGSWEMQESTGFGFNRDGNYLGIEVGSTAPKIPSDLYVYGMDGFGTGGFWAHVAPFLRAPGCTEFTYETSDFIYYQNLASLDLQVGRYTSTHVVYGPHTTWGPRARKASEFMDATITQYGFRPRPKPLVTATIVRGEVTFKQDVTLSAATPLQVLHAPMERSFATEGDAAQYVVTDAQAGTLTYKLEPKGAFYRRGRLLYGGYVSLYPQIFVANTPTVLSLTDDLEYELHADGENAWFDLSLTGKDGKTYHAGDRVSYEFVMLQPDKSINHGNEWLEQFRSQFGLKGALPYGLEVTKGKLQQFSYWLKLAAAGGSVRLSIAKTTDLLLDLPVTVEGLSPNLPAGVYDLKTREFRRIPVDSAGIGYLEINPNEGAKDLFLGNLVTCDQPSVKIEVVSSGQGEAEIVVNNPTDTDLTCVVTGNPDFPPLAGFRQELLVKKGSDQRVKSTLAAEWEYME